MPRRPRVSLPGVPLHLIQRGNNRQACFFADEDYSFYLDHLAEQATRQGCQVHAYCLMTNHVHLLVTPQDAGGAGALMKAVGQYYVQYVNRTYRRSGTLWEGRYRSCVLQDDVYFLVCSRYIEMNPVRAGMVPNPADYRWSSYRANAHGEANPALTPHEIYLALGHQGDDRLKAYRELFRPQLELGMLEQIRAATNGNYALGDERFAAQVAEVLGRRVTRGKPGRPRKLSLAGEVDGDSTGTP